MSDTAIYVIGSAPDCDIVVDAPHVSSRHCQLTYERGGYLLEDLGSTNGTFVNGVRISEETIVTKGERVTLGRNTLMPWPNGNVQGRSEPVTRPKPTAAPAAPAPPPMPEVPVPPRRQVRSETPPPEQFELPPAAPAASKPAVPAAKPAPRFTDPDALDPDEGGSRNVVVIAAASFAGLVVAILLGWAILGGSGTGDDDDSAGGDPDPVDVVDKKDDDDSETKKNDDDDGPKPPPALPPVKTDPERAIVWIGHRHEGGEYRYGTGFVVAPDILLTTGWHAFWLEEGFDNDDVTVVAGFGDTTAEVTGWEIVPIEGDEYGIAKLTVKRLSGLEPIDPKTIGPPPKPQTPVTVIGWNGVETDSTVESTRTVFGAPIVKGQSWKVDGTDDLFTTDFAGGPVTINRRLVGISGVADNTNELRILAIKPALD